MREREKKIWKNKTNLKLVNEKFKRLTKTHFYFSLVKPKFTSSFGVIKFMTETIRCGQIQMSPKKQQRINANYSLRLEGSRISFF